MTKLSALIVVCASALTHSTDSQAVGSVRICSHGTDSLRDCERIG
jgi:hypothetical protein